MERYYIILLNTMIKDMVFLLESSKCLRKDSDKLLKICIGSVLYICCTLEVCCVEELMCLFYINNVCDKNPPEEMNIYQAENSISL